MSIVGIILTVIGFIILKATTLNSIYQFVLSAIIFSIGLALVLAGYEKKKRR